MSRTTAVTPEVAAAAVADMTRETVVAALTASDPIAPDVRNALVARLLDLTPDRRKFADGRRLRVAAAPTLQSAARYARTFSELCALARVDESHLPHIAHAAQTTTLRPDRYLSIPRMTVDGADLMSESLRDDIRALESARLTGRVADTLPATPIDPDSLPSL